MFCLVPYSFVGMLWPVAVWVAVVMFHLGHTVAAPIYSQVTPMEPTAAFSSIDIPTIGQKVADNFVLAGAGENVVRSLRFIGGYGSRNPPLLAPLGSLPDDDFRIIFFEDSSGSPGFPVVGGDFASVTSISRTPTNGQLLNGVTTPLEFVVNLGDGIALNANTEYWISVTKNPDPNFAWSWGRADGVLDSETAATFGEIVAGPWNVFTNGGMWFELDDKKIPEPTSMRSMLITAVAFIMAPIRRGEI